jgi:DNA-binding MarR family transcriptional regulator
MKMASGEKSTSGAVALYVEAEPLRLEGFLPYRLNMLATEVSQSLARAYGRKFGISIPEWRVLATLGQYGVMTARDVGAHSRMHKTTVSRAVAALEKRRLIVRRANRADLREAFLALTDAGTSIYHEIVPMARAFSDSLCESLTDMERQQMDMLIDKLSERVATFNTGG